MLSIALYFVALIALFGLWTGDTPQRLGAW